MKYTIVKEQKTYKIYAITNKDISGLEYNEVDLGLSVKWADRNVGATSPEEIGTYFAWGDTEGYTVVNTVTQDEMSILMSTVSGQEVTVDDVDKYLEYIFEENNLTGNDYTVLNILYNTIIPASENCFVENFNKYYDVSTQTYTKYNETDNLTTLLPEDDAATQNIGSDWRVPTFDEMIELFDDTKVNIETYYKNIEVGGEINQIPVGLKLTSKINGNSIIIPGSGTLLENDNIPTVTNLGANYYESTRLFSNELREDSKIMSKIVLLDNVNAKVYFEDNDGGLHRVWGFPIRAVKP